MTSINGKPVRVKYKRQKAPATRVAVPIYPPGYVHPGQAFRAAADRDQKDMRDRRAAHQRRQAIIDDLKIIG